MPGQETRTLTVHTCVSHVLTEGFLSTELGTVSRNCTEYGWSETFPHYVDACLYEDGNGSHVVGARGRLTSLFQKVQLLKPVACDF